MGKFRPITEYLREAAGLTYSLFLEKYEHPVLIWPQAGDWIDYTDFQFETYVSDINSEEPGDISPHTESQIAQTMVVEIRKQASSAPSNMICVGRAANNDIVLANKTVSKLHTYFLMSGQEDSYVIVDANSTNGTLVNNIRLEAYKNQPLADRDYIQFGPSIQMVYLSPQGFFDLLQQLHRSGVT
jgi:pSer/pThr/pTyr-binding forkhead associated (FHA) protein